MNPVSKRVEQGVQDFLDGEKGLPSGTRVLVAWSGGPDSTALAWCMAQHNRTGRLNVRAAHINHGLRPESTEEAEAVSKMAHSFGLKLITEKLALKPGSGAPARARQARYEVLHNIAEKEECTVIMTAHTLNDQLETVLMRLLRGSGVRGLRGVLAQTDAGLYRPMLGISRNDVEGLIKEQSLVPVHDPTNKDSKYLRTRVRYELLPKLLSESKDSAHRLEALSIEAHELWVKVEPSLQALEPGRALALSELQSIPSWAHGAALERWLETTLDQDQVHRILNLTQTNKQKRQSCPGGQTVHRIGQFLVSGPRKGDPDLKRAFAEVIPSEEELSNLPPRADGSKWRSAGNYMNKKLKDQLRRLGLASEIREMWPVLVKNGQALGPVGTRNISKPRGMHLPLELFQAPVPYSFLGEEGWI